MTTEKKPRTPRNAESILQGALKLSLSEKVEIVKELKKSIEEEVKSKQELANEAQKISNGL